MDESIQEKLTDLVGRNQKERRRFHARRPKPLGQVLSSVIAKRGYAAAKAHGALQDAWRTAAARVLANDGLVAQTSPRGVRRGRLDVTVANHVVMQEINFHRPQLLKAIQEEVPSARVGSIRFQVGRL